MQRQRQDTRGERHLPGISRTSTTGHTGGAAPASHPSGLQQQDTRGTAPTWHLQGFPCGSTVAIPCRSRQVCQPKASYNRGGQHLTGPVVCCFTSGLFKLAKLLHLFTATSRRSGIRARGSAVRVESDLSEGCHPGRKHERASSGLVPPRRTQYPDEGKREDTCPKATPPLHRHRGAVDRPSHTDWSTLTPQQRSRPASIADCVARTCERPPRRLCHPSRARLDRGLPSRQRASERSSSRLRPVERNICWSLDKTKERAKTPAQS
jgi:hypothetical protein